MSSGCSTGPAGRSVRRTRRAAPSRGRRRPPAVTRCRSGCAARAPRRRTKVGSAAGSSRYSEPRLISDATGRAPEATSSFGFSHAAQAHTVAEQMPHRARDDFGQHSPDVDGRRRRQVAVDERLPNAQAGGGHQLLELPACVQPLVGRVVRTTACAWSEWRPAPVERTSPARAGAARSRPDRNVRRPRANTPRSNRPCHGERSKAVPSSKRAGARRYSAISRASATMRGSSSMPVTSYPCCARSDE